MGKMSCFAGLLGGKRKATEGKSKRAYAKKANGNDCPKVKPVVEFMNTPDTIDDVSGVGGGVPAACDGGFGFVARAAAESARRASDEDDDKAAVKRGSSSGADLLHAAGDGSSGYGSDETAGASPESARESSGAGRAPPKLKRSCSNIETARRSSSGLLPAKSRSCDDLKALRPGRHDTPSGAADASPAPSFRSSCSADRVMLKKRSSRQVLPSRSRKLWWRLFLWSHRNLHRPGATATTPATATLREEGAARHRQPHQQQKDGYTSDTLDAATAKNEGVAAEEEDDPGVPSQWVAFSADASSLDRVSAWVNSLGNVSFHAVEGDGGAATAGHDGGGARPRCSEIVELPTTPGRKQAPAKRRAAADEAAHQASSIVQTLNAVSSVAHISGTGLKAVPFIAAFSTLRAVNLSGNLIVQITAGSLPKGLHSLDLSRNKIAIIEGLRELTRLRMLNLSYNRISRIGHGLSSCTSVRELYLAGNKISDVEGLHRLLKLAVLDVSFNRITTAKSLGQLVANYGSLRALNLLGNPVQANAGDDTLRKAVTGLLPRLEYLNKQAVKPQRAREVAKDTVAQAALGNGGGGWSSRRRRHTRRVSQSPGSSGKSPRGRDGSRHRGSRSNSKTRQQGSSLLPRR